MAVSVVGSWMSLSISVKLGLSRFRVKFWMLDSSTNLKRKVGELNTGCHCKWDFLQMNHGLEILRRVQRREVVSSKNKGGYAALFHSPSIVTGLLHYVRPLCTFVLWNWSCWVRGTHSLVTHCCTTVTACGTRWGTAWCRSCTCQLFVIHNRLLPVPRIYQLPLTSVELWHWKKVRFNRKNDILIQN